MMLKKFWRPFNSPSKEVETLRQRQFKVEVKFHTQTPQKKVRQRKKEFKSFRNVLFSSNDKMTQEDANEDHLKTQNVNFLQLFDQSNPEGKRKLTIQNHITLQKRNKTPVLIRPRVQQVKIADEDIPITSNYDSFMIRANLTAKNWGAGFNQECTVLNGTRNRNIKTVNNCLPKLQQNSVFQQQFDCISNNSDDKPDFISLQTSVKKSSTFAISPKQILPARLSPRQIPKYQRSIKVNYKLQIQKEQYGSLISFNEKRDSQNSSQLMLTGKKTPVGQQSSTMMLNNTYQTSAFRPKQQRKNSNSDISHLSQQEQAQKFGFTSKGEQQSQAEMMLTSQGTIKRKSSIQITTPPPPTHSFGKLNSPTVVVMTKRQSRSNWITNSPRYVLEGSLNQSKPFIPTQALKLKRLSVTNKQNFRNAVQLEKINQTITQFADLYKQVNMRKGSIWH